MAGVRHSTVALINFDLDGHAANPHMVKLRRAELVAETGRLPLVSLHHCGNHAANLCEVASVAATDANAHAWMSSGSLFFRMGGAYLRLRQSIPTLVDGMMLAPMLGEPTADAKMATAEIRDFAIKNFKGFAIDPSHDPWSSDDEGGVAVPPAARVRRHLQRERHRSFEAGWTKLESAFNGWLWCDSSSLCAHWSAYELPEKRQLKRLAVEGLCEVVLRSMSVRPDKGNWTKLFMALCWHLLAMGIMNVVPNVSPRAYAAFSRAVIAPGKQMHDPDLAQEYH